MLRWLEHFRTLSKHKHRDPLAFMLGSDEALSFVVDLAPRKSAR